MNCATSLFLRRGYAQGLTLQNVHQTPAPDATLRNPLKTYEPQFTTLSPMAMKGAAPVDRQAAHEALG